MPTHKYLVNVTYLEEKNEIYAYFKNEGEQTVKRFSFFPYFILQKDLDTKKVQELLFDFKIKNFSIEQNNKSNKIVSSSFDTLKKISKVLAKTTNKKHLVLAPERTFLIEKNWSYFDTFSFESSDVFEKLSHQKDFGFHLIPQIAFEEALCLNEKQTSFLVEQSVFSTLLKIPLTKIPKTIQEKAEILLENIFFANGGIISWKNDESFYSYNEFAPFGEYDSISKIDFAVIWPQLFSKNFFNIGQESMNCSCCKPIKLDDSHLLPSSRIEVKFNESDSFFESSSNSFALEFHKNNSGKEIRKQKKREFCLKNYPVGPTKKGFNAKLPIDDAKELLDTNLVSLGKNHSSQWFCLNKESFISKEIRLLNKKLFEEKKQALNKENNLFEKPDFQKIFSSILINSMNSLLQELPFQLTNPLSSFFEPKLAKAIIAIQESTLAKFKKFSEKKGYRVLHVNRKNAFVKGFSSLTLTKSFSEELAIPQPQIASFSKQTKLI
ncbi:MAG: hypothetical protein HOC95_04405 [Candidatus Diapherotrites archaeon]|nr:hypothetical protein [Candidatus Diapherotrites archaeon]